MPNFLFHVTSHVYTYHSGGRFLEKKEYYTSLLEIQGDTFAADVPPFVSKTDE